MVVDNEFHDSAPIEKTRFPWLWVLAILLGFGILFAVFTLFPVLRVKYFERGLYSKDAGDFKSAVKSLAALGPRGREALDRFFEREDSEWGEPLQGLVARVVPDSALFNPDNCNATFRLEVLNYGADDLEIVSDITNCINTEYCVESSCYYYYDEGLETVEIGEIYSCKFDVIARPRPNGIVLNIKAGNPDSYTRNLHYIKLTDDHMECGIWTARIPFIITKDSRSPLFAFSGGSTEFSPFTIAGSPLDGKLKTNPVTIRVKTK
jgi:hypothetical protein